MVVHFSKLVGSGNDFIIVDKSLQTIPENLKTFAIYICRNKFGVGADGLVVLEEQKDNYFRMTCLNPDGSEAAMCGNAVRCCGRYLSRTRGLHDLIVETPSGPHHVKVNDDGLISITFSKPHSYRDEIFIGTYKEYFINTGTEHAVTYVHSVKGIDVLKEGMIIRYDKAFAPTGANVNFVEIINSKAVKIRTYEKGVEDETLSCGSGAVASVLVSRHLKKITGNKVQVFNCTETPLWVQFSGDSLPFKDIWLTGPADFVYEGDIKWD